MEYIHHCSIIEDSFTALKILRALPIHLSRPRPMTTTDLLTVSIASSFPECPIVGIIQHVAFADWLLSLSNMHLSFPHLFLWLGSSFTFSTKYNIPLPGYITGCSPIHLLKDILVTSKFWQWCMRLLWTLGVFMWTIFQLFSVNTKEHHCWIVW